jgi:assimilatory nitrate reductase catalytic subunit
MLEARRKRPDTKIVVIDPRRTATADDADLFLPIKAGTDTVLFNGLLNHLSREPALDREFLEHCTEGYAVALAAARASAPSIAAVATACGLEEKDVASFFHWFARTQRVVSCYSQGVNQSCAGTDKVNSIINCHLATGRIGHPGMGPFSLTGQPNAMGGREAGGLANQLAAHMEIENEEHRERVQRFWRSPRIAEKAGLKAVDLFRAIGRGQVKAVWIMATNPVVSLPDADAVRVALEGCDLVVLSDCVRNTDTAVLAHVLLPAQAWGEKEGTVTNSERRISRQRAFLDAPGDARPDWWIVSEVARRMGHGEAFRYLSAADVFREHAALTAFENNGDRDLNLGGLSGIGDTAYDTLEPVPWPVLPAAGSGHASGDLMTAIPSDWCGSARMFLDKRFFHPGGRARLIAIVPQPTAHLPDTEYPFSLNTGRVRDHWHTMTRTGKSPRLSAHTPEPYVDVHPADAQHLGLIDGRLARVESRWGSAVACVRITDRQRPGDLFVPMHWNDQFASEARIDAVVNPETDPISGQPELKHTPVRVQAVDIAWEALLLTQTPPGPSALLGRWVRQQGPGYCRYRLSSRVVRPDWQGWARSLLSPAASTQDPVEWIEYQDAGAGLYRAAVVCNGMLQGCLLVTTRAGTLPSGDWLGGLIGRPMLSPAERRTLLLGRPGRGAPDAGAIVCSCFGVGRNPIIAAIRDGAGSVDEIGACLGAGTGCGSCRSEIMELIAATRCAHRLLYHDPMKSVE